MNIPISSNPNPSAEKRKAGRPLDEAKRQAIIAAASDRFMRDGFAATSIEQVAADAGVSKVTIYNHFGDKRGLFSASVERECEKMRGHFSLDELPSGTIEERLTVIAQAMFAFLSRPEMIQFERRIAAETEKEPGLGHAFLEAGPWRMKAAFSAWLAHASEKGELLIPDPDLAAEQFASMAKGMGDLERRFGAASPEAENQERIKGAVSVFLAAYGAN
ncbi:TetR/AcrR family transcriptional regulator [Erythrobacter sp. SCSIO 43205]|uniref:TetR/AcrR family transcriptional regulator n=1 Tax=Erythrobacter sp. SCSIO 43205 TaxID=2779361 RepID=UPI002103D4EC|nr:TetR/AcrR family transcriptional regulator [Erythrobacter sp. SCSIO 43205]